MMFDNHLVSTAAIVGLLMVSAPAAPHTIGGASALKSQFQSIYADYASGVRGNDRSRWQKYLTPDFVMVDTEGKLHPAAEMKKYQEINTRTTKRVVSYTNSIEALTSVSGNRVAAIVLQKYARIQAPLERPSEAHEIRTSVIQREWWRRTSKGWRQYRVEELLKGPVYFDGKIMIQ